MTLTKLKDNLYVPVDFAKDHNYYADELGEKAYTGITKVLGVLAKPALIPWAARMVCDYLRPHLVPQPTLGVDYEQLLREAQVAHSKKKEAAGEHGTSAHELVETYIKHCLEHTGGVPALLPSPGIEKFVEWSQAHVAQFLFAERRMADPNLFIAGTADFAYVGLDGKRYMGDFKTSSGIYGIDYFLQVAAYRLLAESEGDAPYDGSAIVRLGKKGDFEAVYRFDYETDKKAFLACLEIYRAQATFVKPKNVWKK